MGASSGVNLAKVTEQVSSQGALTRDDIAALLTLLVDEINENQALTEGLTTVEGAVDSSATAINQHTDAKIAEVLAEIIRTDTGSLYNLLETAVNNDVGWLDGRNDSRATAIINSVLGEIIRTSPGSLYDLLYQLIITVQNNIMNGWDLADVRNEVVTRATPADVSSSRDSINANIDNNRIHIVDLAIRPRILNVGTVSDSTNHVAAYSVVNDSWFNLINVSGSGVIPFLRISRCVDMEIWVDGGLAVSLSGDVDIVNTADVIGSGAKAIPAITYTSSLTVRYKRPTGYTTSAGQIELSRVKYTGV